MMRRGHEEFSTTFVLGIGLGVNVVSHETGLFVSPLAVLASAVLARSFAAGRLSPDVDHLWAPGPPGRGYPLDRHRGITHRFWFVSLLAALGWLLPAFWLLPRVSALDPDFIVSVGFLWLAPVFAWYSHLFGDMIYGRIKFLGRSRGLGWRTGGLSETGRDRKTGTRLWVRDPAAKAFLIASAALCAAHLVILIR